MSKLGDRIVNGPPMEDTGSGVPIIDPITTGEYNELRRELIELRAYRETVSTVSTADFVNAANARAKKWQDASIIMTNAWKEYTLRHDKIMMNLRKFIEEVRPLGGESRIAALAIQDIVDEFNEPS